MKISVIMPVLLEHYEGAADNREFKFMRAVKSFLNQIYDNCELIVISDGCTRSIEILKSKFPKQLKSGLIKLVEIPKSDKRELFVGAIRQKGIDIATGDVICNLDSDDTILPNHLSNIAVSIGDADWAYYSYYHKLDSLDAKYERTVLGDKNNLCTGNIVWKAGLNVTWIGADGRQDNKYFIKQLIDNFPNNKQIYGCGYIVHHAVIK
jgi:glycosyltransferase involved in cell wall biosynthesis